MVFELFTRHPESVGETYGEHLEVAASFAGRLFMASLACLVHALLPFLFERTASRTVHTLHGEMVTYRLRRDDRIRDGVPAC